MAKEFIIKASPAVRKSLAEKYRPFEDKDANDVLERLLKVGKHAPGDKKPGRKPHTNRASRNGSIEEQSAAPKRRPGRPRKEALV